MGQSTQTIKNETFSQVLRKKLWLKFGTYFFFQNNYKEYNITLYIKYSNTRVYLKTISKMRKVSKNHFRLLGTRYCGWCLKNQAAKKYVIINDT